MLMPLVPTIIRCCAHMYTLMIFAVSSATCISKERVTDIVTGIVVDAITVDSSNICSIYRFSGYYCSS